MRLLSIIIPVYNDWTALDSCLDSLAKQIHPPDFEVIVVDDGSEEVAPEPVRRYAGRIPLTIVGQPHSGIPAARNHGIQVAQGAILLFTDADCRLLPNCLDALATKIAASPLQNNFQLRLVGNGIGIIGRTENLRLTTLQHALLQPNGSIRYLNTAGFAARCSSVNIDRGLFNPDALRAEDTYLLAELIKHGELPLFVADAVVQHDVPLSLLECLRKDLRSTSSEKKTFDLIAAEGIQVRMSLRERVRVLVSMWKASGDPLIGRAAWFVLVLRQAAGRVFSLCHTLLPK